jgi:hypothetical protein
VHIIEIITDSFRLKSSLQKDKTKEQKILSDAPPLSVGQEVYVDGVIRDAIICYLGAPHLGAYSGPFFNAFRQKKSPLFL